jgi:hypothetical protein
MNQNDPTKREKLAKLEEALKDLKSKLPEHCAGRTGYVSVHHASLAHWQKIEELEDEIRALKKDMAG